MLRIETILKGIEYVFLAYFTLSSLYILLYAIAGHFYTKNRSLPVKKHGKMAVFIPSYKEDAVIVEVAKSALEQNYEQENFDIIVIADSLKTSTLEQLKMLPIILIEVSFEQSTKAKALNKAMEELSDSYDYAIILDADNIMEVDFLKKMNQAFQKGYRVIQGHRKAKNQNTSFAILDAASEEINNHIFRKGHRTLGLSSGLIGSGMGFEYALFKNLMKSVHAIGGFDKELEFKLAKDKIAIEYLQDAVVFDEKIQKASDFSNQRRRWLSTQFVYLKKYFLKGFEELLFHGNVTFFDKVLQMIIPPRILLLGVSFLIAFIHVIIIFWFQFPFEGTGFGWLLNLLFVVLAFFFALPKSFYNTKTLEALLTLPTAFFRMALLLFKLKGANKKFIHTPHGEIKIQNP